MQGTWCCGWRKYILIIWSLGMFWSIERFCIIIGLMNTVSPCVFQCISVVFFFSFGFEVWGSGVAIEKLSFSWVGLPYLEENEMNPMRNGIILKWYLTLANWLYVFFAKFKREGYIRLTIVWLWVNFMPCKHVMSWALMA